MTTGCYKLVPQLDDDGYVEAWHAYSIGVTSDDDTHVDTFWMRADVLQWLTARRRDCEHVDIEPGCHLD